MTIKLIGTTLEILGTFLIAAEAIKIHNLRMLRDRYLIATVRITSPVAQSLAARHEGRELPGPYFAALVLLGATLVSTLLLFRGIGIFELWTSFRSLVPGPLFVDVAVGVPVAVVLLFTLSLVGSFFIQLVTFPLLVAIVLLDLVEKHAASGLIGILGFILFVVGVSLNAYLDLIGG